MHAPFSSPPDIVVEGYALVSSTFRKLKVGEQVTITRPDVVADAEKSNKKSSKPENNTIVRFNNSKGSEVGRVSERDAMWMSKLIDLGIVSFAGTCLDVKANFKAGA